MNKKTLRIFYGVSIVVLIVLSVLWAITKSFVMQAMVHIVMDLCWFSVGMFLVKKAFRNQVPYSKKKMLFWFGLVAFLDLIVVGNIRYIFSSGISSVLFLPACLPLGFMIIIHYTCKDTGGDNKSEKRISYLVGIPVLLLSLYFEVLAFVQI